MPDRPRLKVGDITINHVLTLSKKVYAKASMDDKKWRANLDVLSAKIVFRRGMEFDPSARQWIQTGREARIQFTVRTKPDTSDGGSYHDRSGIATHTYPVTFLLREFEKGLDSPFRSRVGSLKKPIWSIKKKHDIKDAKDEKTADKWRKENKVIADKNHKIARQNILNGVQLQFIYDSMWVWNTYKLLWGPNYTPKAHVSKDPKQWRNPHSSIFFSKHEYWIIVYVLHPLFRTMQGFLKNKPWWNEAKQAVLKRQQEDKKASDMRTQASQKEPPITPTTVEEPVAPSGGGISGAGDLGLD